MYVPCIDFSPSTATGIKGKLFLDVITAVEAEAVPLAVRCALQLLKQEDDGIVDDAEHPRPAHPAQRQLLQVESGSSFEDAVNHRAPGN